MLAFLYCFNFENEIVIAVNHLTFNLKHHDKCKFAVKWTPLVTTSNIFPLEVVQKCQHCQLCVLRKNSNLCSLPELTNQNFLQCLYQTADTSMHANFMNWLGIRQLLNCFERNDMDDLC